MIEYYGLGFSPFTCPVKLTLDIKGVDYKTIVPDRDMLETEAFGKLSPMRKVPILVIDGTPITESLVIGELLEELYPEPALLPADPIARAQARMLATLANQYVAAPSVKMFSNKRAGGGKDIDADMRELLTRGYAAVESVIATGPFAVGATRTLADCALVPALYFAGTVLDRLGFVDVPQMGEKTATYLKAVAEDADVGGCLASMQAAADAALGAAA